MSLLAPKGKKKEKKNSKNSRLEAKTPTPPPLLLPWPRRVSLGAEEARKWSSFLKSKQSSLWWGLKKKIVNSGPRQVWG